MPQQPSWIDKFNFIKFYWANPCETPMVVYAETGLPAIGRVVLTLLDFGMDDVIRGFFRPKGLRSGRHGRKGKSKKGPKAAIPEVGEMIGEHLPGAEDVKGKHYTDGVKNLWILDGLIQRAAYYLLIIDVVLDFGYDFISGIIKSDQTHCPILGRALREGGEEPMIGALNWNPIITGDLRYEENGVTTSPVTSAAFGPGNWLITIALDAYNYKIDGDARVGVGLFSGSNPEPIALSSITTLGPLGSTSCVATAHVVGPASVFAQARAGNGSWLCLSKSFFVMQMAAA